MSQKDKTGPKKLFTREEINKMQVRCSKTKRALLSVSKLIDTKPENLDLVLVLVPLAPLHLLKELNKVFQYGSGISQSLIAACFGTYVKGIDGLSEPVWHKLFDPLTGMTNLYNLVKGLYVDRGLTDLFPRKYGKKPPTFAEFVQEFGTQNWSRIRSHETIRPHADPIKFERRKALLTELKAVLRISSKHAARFEEDAELYIKTAMDDANRSIEEYEAFVNEDKELARRYDQTKGYTSLIDGIYYIGKGNHGMQMLKDRPAERLRQLEYADNMHADFADDHEYGYGYGHGLLSAAYPDQDSDDNDDFSCFTPIRTVPRKPIPLIEPEIEDALVAEMDYQSNLREAQKSWSSHLAMSISMSAQNRT